MLVAGDTKLIAERVKHRWSQGGERTQIAWPILANCLLAFDGGGTSTCFGTRFWPSGPHGVGVKIPSKYI